MQKRNRLLTRARKDRLNIFGNNICSSIFPKNQPMKCAPLVETIVPNTNFNEKKISIYFFLFYYEILTLPPSSPSRLKVSILPQSGHCEAMI